MPDSAVAAGAVDLHAPVEEMPGHILAARQVRLATLRDSGATTAGRREDQAGDLRHPAVPPRPRFPPV